MRPQPMITVRFVQRLLLILLAAFLLAALVPGGGTILRYLFIPGIILAIVAFRLSFPRTEITVDDEKIRFYRHFPKWHPLRKYYLHELNIPHPE